MTESSSPHRPASRGALTKRFAANVRYYRERKGLSQGDLARSARVGREYINRIERGRYSINLDRFGVIASALEVSPVDLILPRPSSSDNDC